MKSSVSLRFLTMLIALPFKQGTGTASDNPMQTRNTIKQYYVKVSNK